MESDAQAIDSDRLVGGRGGGGREKGEGRKERREVSPAKAATSIVFVAINMCLSRQNTFFAATNKYLIQKYFVPTNIISSRQNLCRDKHFFRDKRRVLSLQKKRLCRDKTFVATKMTLVAAPTTDREAQNKCPSASRAGGVCGRGVVRDRGKGRRWKGGGGREAAGGGTKPKNKCPSASRVTGTTWSTTRTLDTVTFSLTFPVPAPLRYSNAADTVWSFCMLRSNCKGVLEKQEFLPCSHRLEEASVEKTTPLTSPHPTLSPTRLERERERETDRRTDRQDTERDRDRERQGQRERETDRQTDRDREIERGRDDDDDGNLSHKDKDLKERKKKKKKKTKRERLSFHALIVIIENYFCKCNVLVCFCVCGNSKTIVGGSCHKYHFVATNKCLSRQALFVATKEVFCLDKHVFVATEVSLSRQNFCCDKNDTCGSSRQYKTRGGMQTPSTDLRHPSSNFGGRCRKAMLGVWVERNYMSFPSLQVTPVSNELSVGFSRRIILS